VQQSPIALKFRVLDYLLFTDGVLVYYLPPYFFDVLSEEHRIGAKPTKILSTLILYQHRVRALHGGLGAARNSCSPMDTYPAQPRHQPPPQDLDYGAGLLNG